MSEAPVYQRFFAELKRRRVFRAAAAYGAVGFAVLQAADILLPRLGLPDWTVTLAAVLTLLGFPLAVTLAWAYERDAGGVHRTGPADTGELAAIASEPGRRRWPVGLAALAGIALLAAGAWWVLAGPDGAGDGLAAERRYDSIAVLPFVSMSGDREDEYLGDGLAEELLNALTRIEGLKVASRTSAFAFRGTAADARTIGDSLGVATVLEGSVRRSPDRLRVTAQLVDATDGFHLWSETYDRAPADLLDIQDDLTGRIVEALAVALAPADGANGPADAEARVVSAARRGTENPEAYDLYLQGRYFWNKRTYDDMQVAIGLFERAIEADSSFAAAYAAIADAYLVPAGWDEDPREELDSAMRYARLAIEIDPTLAQGHASLAGSLHWRSLDFEAAETSYRRAIELDPSYATAHQWYAELLAAAGRDAEAVEAVRRAESLDPTMIIVWNVARILYFAGRYEEAIAQADKVVEQGGTYVGAARGVQLASLWRLGEYDAVLEFVDSAPAAFSVLGSLAGPLKELRDTLAVIGSDVPDDFAPAFLARAFDRSARRDGRMDAEPDWWDGWRLGRSARLWAAADPDSTLARLDSLAALSADSRTRIVWSDVLQSPDFDSIRADPRFAALNARFGL